MHKPPKIFIEITRNYDREVPQFISQFYQMGFDVQSYYGNDYEIMSKDIIDKMFSDCDIAVSCISPLTARMIDLAPNLRLICTFGAGFDHIDVDAATARGIPVVNGRGGNAVAVSEQVVGMMIALSRNFIKMDHEMRKGLWRSQLGLELHGKTVGIIGMGVVGCELARILYCGFGAKILACDIRENPEVVEKYGVSYVDLKTLCAQSDYVSIHTPLSPSTRGLVGREELALMKPSAFLINTSRGGILNEKALLGALENKSIAGAGLDVFEQEPYRNNAFAQFDNVLTTTHCAANTPETAHRIATLLTESIHDVLAGRRPRNNVINPEIYKDG